MYHDSAVEDLCRLDTFEDSYNTRDFLAGLTDRLISRSKVDPGPFNPRPFIRTFETAVEKLQGLRQQLLDEQGALASSVQVAQSAYSSKIHELSSHFTSVSQSFSSLESRFGEVSRTAITIGEQLENIDRQRQRAVEAHDLIEHYYAFAKGDTSKLDRLRKDGGREGRLQTAVIARRLGVISREVDVPGADEIREAVDRYNERFERDMLKLFDKFYRKSDPRMMSHIAKVLQNFNGGQSCIQIYVNQHDFFISKDRVGEASRIENSPIWLSLPDPDTLPPQTEPNLAALFNEIRATVEQEAQIISAVFPDPLMVMTTFLHRVFAQSVQGYIEVLMNKASEIGAVGSRAAGPAQAGPTASAAYQGSHISDLAFLRVLQMARNMSLTLISDIKVHDFTGPDHGTSAPESSPSLLSGLIGGQNGEVGQHAAANSGGSLTSILESAVEEIFVPYMEGSKYLERESKSLSELYAASLAKFVNYHRTPSKVKTSTIFDRVRAAATSSTSNPSAAPNAATAQSASTSKTSAFSKLSGFVDRARGASSNAPPIPATTTNSTAAEDDASGTAAEVTTPVTASAEDIADNEGDLSLTVAERMLRWHAEAIGRCVDLSNPSDVAKNAFALLKVLAEAFMKSYLETAIDSSTAHIALQDVRSAQMPDLSTLKVVRQVELITRLWQHYVDVALIPLTSSSVTLRREMAIFNNHNLLRVEGKCDALVQRVVDNLLSYLGNRLATQKKNDFAPKNDELAFSRMNTDPCVACSEALERAVKIVRASLGGTNAEAVLLEIGISFHSMLLDHFKKYTVSAAGGLMLTKDLAMYQDSVATFGIPVLNDRFEMLRSLGNLFIVQPSVLRGYMREGSLGKIDEQLLHAFLLRRSDYAKEVRDLGGFTRSNGASGASLFGDEDRQESTAIPLSAQPTMSGSFANARDREPQQTLDPSDLAGNRQGRLSVMLSDLERYAAGTASVSDES
ncbi:unnamed protein product [Parajaminaea phylloscopi]